MRLIYFSPVAWASYRQRPHYMVAHLLERGVDRVTWVDPYPTRLPSLGDALRATRAGTPPSATRGDAGRGTDPRIEVIAPRALPIEPLPFGTALNRATLWGPAVAALRAAAAAGPCMIGVGRPSRLACWALRRLPHAESFYDAMDDFPAFYDGLSARSMARVELEVARSVRHVVCSAPTLVDKFAAMDLRASWVPNGYTMDALPAPSPRTVREVVGYVGTIGRWFDWPLVLEMAHALPGLRVRLIGPEFVPRPPSLPPNVEMRPECSQAEAVERIGAFRVGLIPFLRTPLTDGVDPIKYYEYRALGVPVWTTAFGTMRARAGEPGVSTIASGGDWRTLVDALDAFEDPPARVEAFRRDNDWRARFDALPFAAPAAGARR